MRNDRLKQFFVSMVRRAFWELGLAEREIIEYVSDVLSGFARSDHLYRLRSLEGKPTARSPGEDPFADCLRQLEGWQHVGWSNN